MTTESAKQRKVTPKRRRYAPLEKAAAEICALVLEGSPDTQIAEWFGVDRASIGRFKAKHRADLEAMRAEVARLVTDYAIAHQVNRVADAQLRRDLLDAVRQARASGGTGMETGIVARQYKSLGGGEFAEVVEEYRVDTAFLAEWRANDKQVAEELDQLPRGKDPSLTVNVDNRRVVVYHNGQRE